MQTAYQDRIAGLRAKLDRVLARKVLDQENVESQINMLLQRQAKLERQTSALAGDLLSATGFTKPEPVVASMNAIQSLEGAAGSRVGGALLHVSRSLDNVEQRQTAALADVEAWIENRASSMHEVLAKFGVDPAKANSKFATGGHLSRSCHHSRAPAPSSKNSTE